MRAVRQTLLLWILLAVCGPFQHLATAGDRARDTCPGVSDPARVLRLLPRPGRPSWLITLATSPPDPSLGRNRARLQDHVRRLGAQDESPGLAGTLVELATVERCLGEYAEARKHVGRAVDILRQQRPVPARRLAVALTERGRLDVLTGHPREAAGALREAIASYEQAGLGEDAAISYPLELLAVARSAAGRDDEVRQPLARTLRLRTRHLGPEHRHTLEALKNTTVLSGDLAERLEAAARLRTAYEGVDGPAASLERIWASQERLIAGPGDLGLWDRTWRRGHRELASLSQTPRRARDDDGGERSFPAPVSTGDAGERSILLPAEAIRVGDLLQRFERWRRAERFYLDLVEAARVEEPGNEGRLATLLDQLGALRLRRGRWNEAAEVLVEAVDLLERDPSARPVDRVPSLAGLAEAEARRGRLVQSRTLWRRTVELQESIHGSGSLHVAVGEAAVASLDARLGDVDAATAGAGRVLDAVEAAGFSGPQPLEHLLAPVVTALLEKEAHEDVDRLLGRRAWNDSALVRAAAAVGRQDIDLARDLLVRALHRLDVANALSSNPELLSELVHARNYFALDAEFNWADWLFGTSRELRLIFSGKQGARMTRFVRRFPWGHTGHFKLFGDPLFFEVASEVLRAMDRHEDAEVLLTWGMENAEKRHVEGHPVVVALKQQLAETLRLKDDPADALALARDADRQVADYVADAIAALPESEALRLVANRPRPDSVLFSGLLQEDNPKPWLDACWASTLRHRALVLDELAWRRRVASLDPEPRKAWEALNDARHRVAALWVSGENADREQSREALRRRDEAEAAMAAVSARYRGMRRARGISIGEIVRALPVRSALVEYVRVPVRLGDGEPEARYVALLLDHRGRRDHVDLGPASAIDDTVRRWRQTLQESLDEGLLIDVDDALVPGRRLHAAVWRPVASRLPEDIEVVFLVPDGSLHVVSFAALPLPDGGFNIEKKPAMHLLSTGRDLLRLQEEHVANETGTATGLLALGDPDFDAHETARRAGVSASQETWRGRHSACRAIDDLTWRRLPESGIEAREVAALLGEPGTSVVLTGDRASEERFKQAVTGRRFVHLATHGFFLGETCHEDTDAAHESPLLQSGLVLAGANRLADQTDGDDGLLTAEELAAMSLEDIDLMALSACDTGLGPVTRGEGVVGLRRALEIAGTRTVVMSLWPVPDRQARRWMAAFYRAYVGGASVVDASRQAGLSVLGELREEGILPHPYLWAGFVAAGDWRGKDAR